MESERGKHFPIYNNDKKPATESDIEGRLVKIAVVLVAVLISGGVWTGQALIASGFLCVSFLLTVIAWHLIEIARASKAAAAHAAAKKSDG